MLSSTTAFYFCIICCGRKC